MDILGAESEFVTAAAESWLHATGAESAASENVQARSKKSLPASKRARSLPAPVRTPFEELPVALQRRSIQLQLLREGITPDYDLVEHLRLHPLKPIDICEQRIKSPENCLDHKFRADEPHGSRAFRLLRDNSQIVRSIPKQAVPFQQGLLELDLRPRPGHMEWDGVKFAWQIQPVRGIKRPKNLPGIEVFDAQAVGHTVVVRHWHPGDRFQPIGMAKSSKLQDLFVNQKVPHALRRQLIVACTAQGDLFWVESLRVSERFKLTKSTIRRLHWAWQRL
jgi:tRNA(Ile)-lysidine synthase